MVGPWERASKWNKLIMMTYSCNRNAVYKSLSKSVKGSEDV